MTTPQLPLSTGRSMHALSGSASWIKVLKKGEDEEDFASSDFYFHVETTYRSYYVSPAISSFYDHIAKTEIKLAFLLVLCRCPITYSSSLHNDHWNMSSEIWNNYVEETPFIAIDIAISLGFGCREEGTSFTKTKMANGIITKGKVQRRRKKKWLRIFISEVWCIHYVFIIKLTHGGSNGLRDVLKSGFLEGEGAANKPCFLGPQISHLLHNSSLPSNRKKTQNKLNK